MSGRGGSLVAVVGAIFLWAFGHGRQLQADVVDGLDGGTSNELAGRFGGTVATAVPVAAGGGPSVQLLVGSQEVWAGVGELPQEVKVYPGPDFWVHLVQSFEVDSGFVFLMDAVLHCV